MHLFGVERFDQPVWFLKVVLTRNIETIRDLGGTDQAASLELIVEDLEKDVDEWRCMNNSSLTSLVKEDSSISLNICRRFMQRRKRKWKQSSRS